MWVWMQTESLVLEKDQTAGRLVVDAIMLKVHWDQFEEDRITNPLVREMSRDLQYQSYQWEFLSLEPSASAVVPTDPWEYAALERLREDMRAQLERRQQEYEVAAATAEKGQRTIAGTLVVLPFLLGGLVGRIEWSEPAGPPLTATVIQAGIPQDQKWQPQMLEPTRRFYRGETLKASDSDIVLWPEVAVGLHDAPVQDPII